VFGFISLMSPDCNSSGFTPCVDEEPTPQSSFRPAGRLSLSGPVTFLALVMVKPSSSGITPFEWCESSTPSLYHLLHLIIGSTSDRLEGGRRVDHVLAFCTSLVPPLSPHFSQGLGVFSHCFLSQEPATSPSLAWTFPFWIGAPFSPPNRSHRC